MLPVSYRNIVFVDPRDSKVYSSNGSYLERFVIKDDYLVFEKSWKILENGTPITGIFDFPDESRIVVSGEEEITLFDPKTEKSEAKDVLSDRIIISKPLKSGEICVVSGRKKLIFYKISDSKFQPLREWSMGTKATIFSCTVVGDYSENLTIYTGNVLGKIEVFNLVPSSSSHLEPILTISKHDGMVFSICVFGSRIYSISDDRSIRVFDSDSGEEVAVRYGHETRPRSLAISADGDRIFTGGDSLCIWKWNRDDLVLTEKRETGIGKIYSIAVCNHLLLASSVTGALVALGLDNKPFRKSIVPGLDGLIVRNFIKISDEKYFIVDNKKDLLFLDGSNRTTIIKDQKLRSEGLTISRSRNLLAVTNEWKIFVIDVKTKKLCSIATEDVLGGAVFAGDTLIAVSKTGKALTVKISNNILSKTEWSMNLKYSLSCSMIFKDHIICGFGRGSVAIYDTGENPKEVFFSKVSKRSDTVVDLAVIESRLFVLTRDGKCSIFTTDNFPNLTLSEVTSTIPTPEKFFLDDFTGNRYIWGFKSVDFVISTVESPNPLISLECGGGNRPHNLDPVYSGTKLIGFNFEFVKKGILNVVEITLPLIQHVVGPYHKNSIFALSVVPSLSEKFRILTAGVDTEIQLHELDESGRARRKWMSSSHLSSVNSLFTLEKSNGDVIVGSAGGNSEIKIWKVGENSLNHLADYRGTPDYRYIVFGLLQMSIYQIFIINRAGSLIFDWENKQDDGMKVEKTFSYPLDIVIEMSDRPTVIFGERDGIKVKNVVTAINGQPIRGSKFENDTTGKEEDFFEFIEKEENYPLHLSFAPPVLTANEKIIIASTFHSLYAIAAQLSPAAKSSGIKMLETTQFRLHCFQSYTGLKFIVVASTTSPPNLDSFLRKIYEIYSDYALKNPFQSMDMPIRGDKFDEALKQLIEKQEKTNNIITL